MTKTVMIETESLHEIEAIARAKPYIDSISAQLNVAEQQDAFSMAALIVAIQACKASECMEKEYLFDFMSRVWGGAE